VCIKSITVIWLRAWNGFGVWGRSIHQWTCSGICHREQGNSGLPCGQLAGPSAIATELMHAPHPESCTYFWPPLHLYNTIRLELRSAMHRLPSELFAPTSLDAPKTSPSPYEGFIARLLTVRPIPISGYNVQHPAWLRMGPQYYKEESSKLELPTILSRDCAH
jgi:hypothetical protein